MPVRITKGGVDYHLVPAPLVNYEKTFLRLANGQLIGNGYNITLNGDILPNKGHPIAVGSSGSFSTSSWTTSISPDDDPLSSNLEDKLLAATIAKQQKIQELFTSGTAIPVMIYGYGESSGISFVGNVENITFPEDGRWALPSKYSIVLSTNKLDGEPESFNYFISDAQENWNIVESDQVKLNFNGYTLESINKVFNVTHTLSAVGRPVYNTDGSYLNGAPWQQASGYVRSVLGLGTGQTPNSLLSPLFTMASGYGIANRKIEETVDELAGSYAINETFTAYKTGISPFPALEQMSFSVDQGEEYLQSVNVQGTIQGLDTFQNTSQSNKLNSYFNASGYFDAIQSHIYNRALSITKLDWIHPIPVSKSVARDPNAGTIVYSYSYNDRPPNIISGSISEDIAINDTYPGQYFAIEPVIGRDQPILQYLNSRSEYRRTLSIDVSMGRITSNWSSGAPNGYWSTATSGNVYNWLVQQKPSVTQTQAFQIIFDAANPANDSGVIPSKVFYTAPQETWNPKTGRYSYTIEWVYAKN